MFLPVDVLDIRIMLLFTDIIYCILNYLTNTYNNKDLLDVAGFFFIFTSVALLYIARRLDV